MVALVRPCTSRHLFIVNVSPVLKGRQENHSWIKMLQSSLNSWRPWRRGGSILIL